MCLCERRAKRSVRCGRMKRRARRFYETIPTKGSDSFTGAWRWVVPTVFELECLPTGKSNRVWRVECLGGVSREDRTRGVVSVASTVDQTRENGPTTMI